MGTRFVNKCKVDVLALLRQAERAQSGPLFYDLYYVDGMSGDARPGPLPGEQGIAEAIPGTPVLYPVPVSILDGPASTADTLVRRFFVLDTQLGSAYGSGLVSWIQFPVSAELTITVRLPHSLL